MMTYPFQLSHPRPYYYVVLVFPRGMTRAPIVQAYPQLEECAEIYSRATITHGEEEFTNPVKVGSAVVYKLKETDDPKETAEK